MKFLHTSDWHLGKTLCEKSLLEDQKNFLDQILMELKNDYQSLIVSGDIYDRAIPPVEAVNLLSDFLNSIKEKFPHLHVFINSGNHDSSERLGFAKEILEAQNIHIASDCKNITVPVTVGNCDIYQLPYLVPGIVKKQDETLFDSPLKTQQELFDRAKEIIFESRKKSGSTNKIILNCHVLAFGSIRSESERISVGDTDSISTDSFGGFDYVAMGHIHSFAKVTENAFYPGSPLSYSFGESNDSKFMIKVEFPENGEFYAEKIPFKPLHQVVKLTGMFMDFENKFDEYKNDYLSLECTDNNLIINPVAKLQKKFPNLLMFSYKDKFGGIQNNSNSMEQRRKALKQSKNQREVFKSFLREIYDEDTLEKPVVIKEMDLFEKLAGEAQ